MREETKLPAVEEVAVKLGCSFQFPQIAKLWLIRKGYRDKELLYAFFLIDFSFYISSAKDTET
jgi:hypothetical protein